MEGARQLQEARIDDIKQRSDCIIASIRINPKNYTDAFITNPEGGPDIYIEGHKARNGAMEGDIVEVKINHCLNWKLNQAAIANRWDEWSEHLMPIIEGIEESHKFCANESAEVVNNQHDNSDTAKVTLSGRKKRSVNSSPNMDSEVKASNVSFKSKLPTNLPSGISQLEVKHVINLPFSSSCLQKTGTVISIVKRNHPGVAGGLLRYLKSDYALFSPIDSRVPRMLINIAECPADFASQSHRYKNVLFIAQIILWDGSQKFAHGVLVKMLGDCNMIQNRMEALLMEHQIYDEDFGDEAYTELDYLNHLPANWLMDQAMGRRDLTNDCIFTIDPKTARDLDDAVSIKQIAEQIYEVGVHIADVSYFVRELTAVDHHARLRTTSVYLVDRVIPMLPRILCEQMCSLNPGEPKLTFSVIWKMDKYGRIIDQWFGRTIVKSCVKLAYEQAQDMINNPRDVSWIKEGVDMPTLYNFTWERITKSVVLLNKIAQNLRAKRFDDGALRIDQVKMKFELDSTTGCPTGFTFEERGAANYLIEEYMLLANMAVAKRIYHYSKDLAFLRRHMSSPVTQLREVKEFCDAKGCPLDVTSSGTIQKSLNKITDPTMLKVVSYLLLRSMKNAEYVCTGSLPVCDDGFRHFALNVPFYTHFTSPIRRYADIVVHRLLALALEYETESHEDVDSEAQLADECTKRKISSKLISDTSQKWYFNLFVQKAGFCELLACVTRIYDHSIDVILIDYDRSGRVYLDKLKSQMVSLKFESFSGIKRLVLNWKPSNKLVAFDAVAVDNVNEASSNNTKKSKSAKKKKQKQKEKDQMLLDQANSRLNLETSKGFCKNTDFRINEAINDTQIIEVFDVIRVIVTVDEKDITQLKINLKTPNQ